MAQEIPLTIDAYNAYKAEYEEKTTVGRDDVAQRIKEARSYGDLSENSEYDEALNDQAKLEARISQLEFFLTNGKIIDNANLETDVVSIGSTVELCAVGDDEVETYQILGESQANPDEGIISDQSPIGKALLEHKVGDKVSVNLPNGNVISFEILKISK